MLALMTALHAEPGTNLIGIEEPENYVHPTALSAFLDHLRHVQDRIQFMVTTHSPLLLDLLDAPEAVRVVRRDSQEGTTVVQQEDPEGVRRALEASDFGLGEYYETKGFGSDRSAHRDRTRSEIRSFISGICSESASIRLGSPRRSP